MKGQFLKLIIPCFVFGLFSVNSHANVCENKTLLDQSLEKTQYYAQDNLYACKTLAHEKNVALLAVAQFVPHAAGEDEYGGDYDLHLFKVDAQTGKLLKKYLKIDTYISDAIALRSIEIDSAPYRLTENIRAIGIRTNYEGGSRVFPYNNSSLHLYDLDNKNKMLSGLVVDLYRGENDGQCNSEWEEHKGTLQMLHTKTQGYADIRVNIKIKSEGMKETNNDCIDLDAKYNQVSFVMKFDGKAYQIPKPFKEIYSY